MTSSFNSLTKSFGDFPVVLQCLAKPFKAIGNTKNARLFNVHSSHHFANE